MFETVSYPLLLTHIGNFQQMEVNRNELVVV